MASFKDADGFVEYLRERKLVNKKHPDVLRGTKVAIDAQRWIERLMRKSARESLQAAMGGAPLRMKKIVEAELDRFKKSNVTPVFVFNGLNHTSVPRTEAADKPGAKAYDERERAWKQLHTNQGNPTFTPAPIAPGSASYNAFIQILRQNKVEFLKAPYMAWAQMAYWCQPKERCVHQIQGPNELIMFEHVEVLILDFHFDANPPEFEYIIKSEIKNALVQEGDLPPAKQRLTDLQFLDTCLLSSLDGCSMHNALTQILRGSRRSKAFFRERALIRHSVVFTLDGQCQPMTAARSNDEKGERVPCNLSDLWGLRLPNILYFFLSIGAIQTQVLINVVQNQMIETIPQIDTEDYRILLERILPLRTQIAHQLIAQLSSKDERYSKREPMNCWRWYQRSANVVARPPGIVLDEWAIEHHEIVRLQKEHKEKYGTQAKLDFLFVVTHFHKKATQKHHYRSTEEVVCAIHLKALDLLGHFTHATSPEDPQSGLSMFSDALMKTNAPEFSEYSVLLIELLRTKALTCVPFKFMKPDSHAGKDEEKNNTWESGERSKTHFPAQRRLPLIYAQAEPQEQQHYNRCCLLVSRIWSLLPMQLKEEAWNSEVSKDLLAFNTVVRGLHKTLRNLIEVIAAVLFLEKKTEIDPYHYNELPQHLPFGQESNTAMGIVIDYILRSDEHFGEPTKYYNRATRLQHLKEKFPCCEALEEDLQRGLRFWRKGARVIWFELRNEKPPNSAIMPMIDEIFPYADIVLRLKLNYVIDLGDEAYEPYEDPTGPPEGA